MNDKEYMIMQVILENKYSNIDKISSLVGITKSYTSRIINKLERKGYLKEYTEGNKIQKGRPLKLIEINKMSHKILVINISDNEFEIAISDILGEITYKENRHYLFKKGLSLVKLIIKELDLFLEKYNIDEIVGIGIVTDENTGYDIFKPIEVKYNIPVLVEEKSKAIFKSELINNIEIKEENMFYIYINDKVYSSLMYNSKIVLGDKNNAGKISHLRTVKDRDLGFCSCGKKNCMNILLANNKFYEIGLNIRRVLEFLDISNVLLSNKAINSNIIKGLNRGDNDFKIIKSKIESEHELKAAISMVRDNLFKNLRLIK